MKEQSGLRTVAMAGALALGLGVSSASAAIWSDTEVQVLYGSEFQEPFNPNDVSKTIVTLQHASGWEYGRNFFFVDMINSDEKDANAGEVYGEWYSTFSLSKLTGKELKFGIIKDIGLTAGLNYGAKSGAGPTANPEVYTAGVTLDFDFPKFAFFIVDIQAYMDRGKFGGVSNGCNDDTFQVTPAWKLPFQFGAAKFTFEGFVDFIGDHGACEFQILAQPQLRLDVGNFMGKPDKVYVGLEYQYWDNKYGIDGLKDDFPQLLGVWKF